jgi:hypothetical protein
MHGKDKIEPNPTPTPEADHSVEVPSTDQPERHRGATRLRSVLSSTPVRLALATSVTAGLGLVAFVESRSATAPAQPVSAGIAERAVAAEGQPATRSSERAPLPTSAPTSAAPVATSLPTASPTKPAPPPKKKPAKPARPKPVAGLTQDQMDNANIIVQVGRKLGVPRRGLVVAVATALQESNLYNLASDVLPESLNYPHQGTGGDHDSVGLFQQRTSSGWGAVADLMRPAFAAEQFYRVLLQVPGWQQLAVTIAAQSVQGSAFPYAYAQHEGRATTIVDALLV